MKIQPKQPKRMKQLITIADVRRYRQIGKQINSDNFTGRVNEVQDNQLTELLGAAMAYELENYLTTNWTTQAGTFTKVDATTFKALGVDLTGLDGYALLINSDVYVLAKLAVFDGIDTTFFVSGYTIPDTITTLSYKQETNYLHLLNGTSYTYEGKPIPYNGIRPFLVWNLLAIFAQDGDLKHSDTGNINITGELFDKASSREKQIAADGYLKNASREENHIIQYLNTINSFDAWSDKSKQNITRFAWFMSD